MSEAGVVRSALQRALGPSLGSIALGSLIVALLKVAETIVRFVRDLLCTKDPEDPTQCVCFACMCCLEFVLSYIRSLVEYFNRWAYTYCAVYGDGFVAAGRQVHALFARRGWDYIISDELCSLALTFTAIAIAIVAALVAFALALVMGLSEGRGALVFCAFLTAYMCALSVVAVLDAAVCTVLVCFAEDPRPCLQHHPEEFVPLWLTWFKFYGDELRRSGYNRLIVIW
mmetsp:Transcript_33373/g.75396  ORF Transcript_33373/g.75396 Transcript_33373/m.75396 type:complete len:228 (+) Transcript_33373:1794-2477(+)